MALRGNLKELSLPDIFQLVTFSGKTGVLRIHRSDDARGSVWFRDGEVFFAQSNWRTEPLGERLVRAQRITPMALDRALELRAAEPEGGKRLGEILVEQGYITDKVLEAFVQEQMQDTIFDLMRWDEGDFEFEAMPEALEEDIGLSVSIENVIMEGSRRLDEWNRIKKKIPSTDIVFKMATAPGEGTFEISLKPIEWNLLLLVDGTRSVADLAVDTNRTDFEVARIVYGLFSAGLLEFASDEEVVALRAEREVREAKAAELEKKLAAEQAAAEKKRPAKPKAEPRKAAAEKVAPVPESSAAEAQVAPEIEQPEAVEVPEFLGGGAQQATDADLAALEAAMGAVLEHATPPAPPAEQPEVSYTPGEEPAFIAASRETSGGDIAVPTVEELLGDIAELAPPTEAELVSEVTAAPEEVAPPAPEIEAVAQFAPEIEVAEPEPVVAEPELVAAQPEPELLAEPEPTVEPQPMPVAVEPQPEMVAQTAAETPSEAAEVAEAGVPEAQFEFVPAEVAPEPETIAPPVMVEAAPEPEAPAEPAIAPAAAEGDMSEDLRSVAAALEEPEPATPQPLEPGTFVVVPTAVEPVGDQGDFIVEVEPLDSVVPEVVRPAQMAPVEAELAPAPDESVSAEAESAEEQAAAIAEVAAAPAIPGLNDFEHDLMSLGLGELPAELLESEPVSPTVTPAQAEAPVIDLEPVVEPMGVLESVPEPAVEPLESVEPATIPEVAGPEIAEAGSERTESPVDEEADFSDLLQSLDISADDAQAVVPPAVDLDLEPGGFSDELLEGEPAPSSGVISTDAFLDDLALESDLGFSGELTNELSALTGADRPSRPSASVQRLPAEGESALRRDMRVDRETLLKVIDGIKNL